MPKPKIRTASRPVIVIKRADREARLLQVQPETVSISTRPLPKLSKFDLAAEFLFSGRSAKQMSVHLEAKTLDALANFVGH